VAEKRRWRHFTTESYLVWFRTYCL